MDYAAGDVGEEAPVGQLQNGQTAHLPHLCTVWDDGVDEGGGEGDMHEGVLRSPILIFR